MSSQCFWSAADKTPSNLETENVKLQQRMALLREEYVKLQTRLAQVEREHDVLRAACPDHQSAKAFVSKVLDKIAALLNNPSYSDVTIKLPDQELFGHKLVLSARNPAWSAFPDGFVIDWSDLPEDVGRTLVRWIYTNQINLSGQQDCFVLSLMKTAKSLTLEDLFTSCERALIAVAGLKNCISFYLTAEEIGADVLQDHCSQLISTHWDDFCASDFESMDAPRMYNLCKSKARFPLHSAIRLRREDVVFLYLLEFDHVIESKVNSPDERGMIPLDLALCSHQEDLCKTLIKHRANVNQVNGQGKTLLHLALERKDVFSCLFLCDHGAKVDLHCPDTGLTPLHLAARHDQLQPVVYKILELGADVNAQDLHSRTPLHVAIEHANISVLRILISKRANLDSKTGDGLPALWLALTTDHQHEEQQKEAAEAFPFTSELLSGGASANVQMAEDSQSLVHSCLIQGWEAAALFLVDHGAKLDQLNRLGQAPLHLAAEFGMEKVVRRLLLHAAANPNIQTSTEGETALHVAVNKGHLHVVDVLLQCHQLNVNLKDAQGRTPLSLTLCSDHPHKEALAKKLLDSGADIDARDSNGNTLLQLTIMQGHSAVAIFLLNHGADANSRTSSTEETCLELAIKKNLAEVVECLCKFGADMSACSDEVNPPLWIALAEGRQDLAGILIKYGVDADNWGPGPDGCQQTLLHRAIDENLSKAAVFLVQSGCDLNSARRAGPDGSGGEEAHDLASPLHLCCQWNLEDVVYCLVENGAAINAQDVEGKTPLHHAIQNGHQQIIHYLLDQVSLDLSVRDKSGMSAFATAMAFRNNFAAKRILEIEPMAAEQFDQRGRNFLHSAILKNDLESVLFLLSIHVNLHSRTQDANQLTPLLLAVQKSNEMIVRNLILAGASVYEDTPSGTTALHLAAEANLPNICSILLAEHADCTAVDCRGNSALHLAVKEGHLDVVRVLLTESRIDAEAVNAKGRNPLHILANFGQEDSVAIFDVFMQLMPGYPIDQPDAEGNTPLLLAYMKGNGALCRALVKYGATLGTLNHQGVSIFSCHVATKQLLHRLLDFLGQEPKWGEGDICEECHTRFGITTRKHHCRHCGRLLCNKCSSKEMPILKYNVTKPVRVCGICFEVLSGVMA